VNFDNTHRDRSFIATSLTPHSSRISLRVTISSLGMSKSEISDLISILLNPISCEVEIEVISSTLFWHKCSNVKAKTIKLALSAVIYNLKIRMANEKQTKSINLIENFWIGNHINLWQEYMTTILWCYTSFLSSTKYKYICIYKYILFQIFF